MGKNENRRLRTWYCIWVIVCSIFCRCVCVEDQKPEEEENRKIYFVLVEGEPLTFHGRSIFNSETVRAEAKKMEEFHEKILETELKSGSYRKLYSFKHVLNAFAVHTTPSQAKKLEKTSGVKVVEEDRGVKLLTTYTPEFLELPKKVWSQIDGGDRRAGDGVVMGFVDTGIEPSHPSFACDPRNHFSHKNVSHFSGACEIGPLFPAGSCNCKIVSARFFSAGARAAATLNSSVDILSPFDSSGHGSHVASIAAGNIGVPVVVDGFFYGRASGIAPRARIAVYKAVYPTVGTLTDVVAAIDQAIMDGVDVLTLSVGPDEPPEGKPTVLGVFDVAMLFARKAGVFVVQAAGNHGPAPSSVVSYSPWVVGAAAGKTDRSYPGSLVLGSGSTVAGIGLSGPTVAAGLLQHRLVVAKDAIRAEKSFPLTAEYIEECQHPEVFDPLAVVGSIVVCTFSDGFYNQTSTVAAIVDTAKSLRFMGFVLIANPKYGDFVAEPIIFSVSGILIPKVSDSQIILQYYEEKTYRDQRGVITQSSARAAIGENRNTIFTGKAPVVSRFSARGPDFIDVNRNPLDVLKPDFFAPGDQIWGAWSPISALNPILTGRRFALLSGTSMAAPHIAGIAALIKQRNPSWNPSMIASALSTTSTSYDNTGEIIMTESYDVDGLYPSTHFDRGAGHISPARAMDPGLVLSAGFEDYISFLCSLPNISSTMVEAATGVSCTVVLSHPANLNLPSLTVSELKGSLLIKRSFKNAGNKTEAYLVSVLPPNGTAVRFDPPWFTVSAQGTQDLDIGLSAIEALNEFTFGEIVLTGSLNHIIRIPLTIRTVPMV